MEICCFDSSKICNEDNCNVDSTRNLCDSCVHCYPECDPYNIRFGNGLGNDNIKCCSDFQINFDMYK